MKSFIIPCIAAAFAASSAFAAPADDAKAAAKKLADAPNYAWTTTTENAGSGGGGGFGGGSMTGVAEKNGFTVITRETQMGPSKSIRKGEQLVMEREGNWMSMDELRAQMGGGQGGGQGQGGQRGGRGMGMIQPNPAEELASLIEAAKDLKVADGSITGSLSEEAVTRRLSFGGRGGQAPAAKNASGSLKIWVKDGAVTKYQVNVKGTVAGRDGAERQIDRTTTTEIKDVGTAKVEVPEAAKKKFSA